MDPDTENHLAALIMEEASRLRLQAEKDGVHVYLAKPKARGRPNSQFLQATVRNVEQANRAAEINDMWRRRAMELELEHRNKEKQKRKRMIGPSNESEDAIRWASSSHAYHGDPKCSKSFTTRQASTSPRLHVSYATDRISDGDSEYSHGIVDDLRDEGLKDDEVEQFLQSRVKRGRGAIGSRMDEPGPYPLPQPGRPHLPDVHVKEDWEDRFRSPVAGPLREVERDQLLDSKRHKKKRCKDSDMEGLVEEEILRSQQKEKQQRSKKKHSRSHKASKKQRRKDDRR